MFRDLLSHLTGGSSLLLPQQLPIPVRLLSLKMTHYMLDIIHVVFTTQWCKITIICSHLHNETCLTPKICQTSQPCNWNFALTGILTELKQKQEHILRMVSVHLSAENRMSTAEHTNTQRTWLQTGVSVVLGCFLCMKPVSVHSVFKYILAVQFSIVLTLILKVRAKYIFIVFCLFQKTMTV